MIDKNKIITNPLSSLACQKSRKFVTVQLSISLEWLSMICDNLIHRKIKHS